MNYNDVLKEAQRLGYAEADPTSDIEGYDAQYKLAILAALAFGTKIDVKKIKMQCVVDVFIFLFGFSLFVAFICLYFSDSSNQEFIVKFAYIVFSVYFSSKKSSTNLKNSSNPSSSIFLYIDI